MSTSLTSTVALVTGANRGIGRALTEALLARGATKVYATARNADSLADLVAAHPNRIVPLTLDVTQPDQVAAIARTAADATLIINNAGALANPDLFAATLDDARQEFEVNYWGTLHVIRAFVPQLKAHGSGVIVNLSSVAGLTSFPMYPTYSDSKAAVHSLTAGARLLLADAGIRLIGVYPGPVDTDMAKDIEMPKETPETVAATILDGIENGAEEVFTDEFARTYREPYEAGQKTLEKRIAAMMQPAA
ncbi:SDR family oxidoreductase [Actomonas aquatica]|uniref:SDR family oxidoreductase n=1 Tax=Actomonas aquatica TaxID=2866162 RepID=A0ABZ1C2X8_9BACT|nr:SDR family oxidoreductase [Opitutus sp. WL0086]WRQ85801.1 SDR family oxidoreductase [Opitutus sp. WL0086]